MILIQKMKNQQQFQNRAILNMKIPLNDTQLVYEKIIKGINVAQGSIVLFVALDVDALCTFRILSTFFKNQNIEYRIYPVTSYTELEQKIQDCKCYQKIKLFFFINCGGLIDLSSKWFSKTAQVFLFDVNKPIHHANVQAPNIKIIDDDFGDLEKAPTVKQFQLHQNIDDELIQEMEQRQNEAQSDQDQDIVARRRKRHRSSQQAMHQMQKIRKVKTQLAEKIERYYSHQFFSLPSSYIAYVMIKDLNKSNNIYLWLAIVGLTAMHLQQKIQKQQFDIITNLYKYDMLKFNASTQGEKNLANKNSIKSKLDFMFPLFRHWSLYDSIMNSAYMISELAMWDQTGVKKLYQLINLIGLSLQQSKQLYKFMSKSSMDKLQNQIFKYAEKDKFKLLDVGFQSFAKQVDYAFELTASDYYYILATILEKPTKKVNINEVVEQRVQNFWVACEVFTTSKSKLQQYIEDAKKVVAIYVRQARSVLQRNHIITGNAFSFVNLLNDTQDRKHFQHPNSLIKLSYMLMQMNNSKKKKNRPFIASLQNNKTQTVQLVGILNDVKNPFNYKFNLVIQKHNIQVRMDCFMNNIMTVPKESLISIIKQLGEM